MKRTAKHRKSSNFSKLIGLVVTGAILFWSAFWPVAYIASENMNSNLKEKIKNNEYLSIKEKKKILGENL
jgi:hypothetical protein